MIALFLAARGHADEEREKKVEEPEIPVVRDAVEESAFAIPSRTVQIPVFKNGKWNGYREEPLDPATSRLPATDNPETQAPRAPETQETK